MKRFGLMILSLLVCAALTGCCMSHEWQEATCAAPRTCAKCGKTEGETLAHTWQEATCAAPKTCSVCQAAEGELGDHVWQEATCAGPKTCTLCGKTEGVVLDHTWVEATLRTPRTCTACGETEGTATNFFAVNGLEVLEELPREVTSTAVLVNMAKEANQETTQAVYQNITARVEAGEDGAKKVEVDFDVSYEYRTNSAMGFNNSVIDYNFFDLYTGELIPIDGACKIEVEDQSYEVRLSASAYGDHGEERTLEDGSIATPFTLNLRFVLDVPEGYDGLVLAIADLKHYGVGDRKWQNGLVKGMHAGEFAQYTDYYESVRFFHIPVA